MKLDNLLSEINFSGISYEKFMEDFQKFVEKTDAEKLSGKELELYTYTKLNYQRTQRIHKTFKPNEDLLSAVKSIEKSQIWMVLTEHWCGDSAQSLPYIAEIAKLSENIDLKILYRDQHLEIMDLYLTDGKSRSVPKLVAFNEFGEELFQWGPRPVELINQIDKWKSEGLTKNEFLPMLHLWYAKDKGQQIMKEFSELIK